MSEYIDKQEVLDAIDVSLYKDHLKLVIGLMEPADVVEVVRCKDCKIGGWKVSEIDGKTKGYQCPVHAYIQDDDGYCSNGERKDGEEE